jgi:hypothetical protein
MVRSSLVATAVLLVSNKQEALAMVSDQRWRCGLAMFLSLNVASPLGSGRPIQRQIQLP